MFFSFGILLFVLAAQLPAQVPSNAPPENKILMGGVKQESNGAWRYLRYGPSLETSDMLITADEIDYNSDTHWAYARGHVRMEHFQSGDKINADRAEYNLETQEGKFWNVSGTSPAKIMTSPGLLTTTNPFYFRAKWAERIRDRYILHHAFVTDCTVPKPWWTFEAPVFDIIPGDRAMARHTLFRIRNFPIIYLPYFYRPLGKNPRQSGFLTPNIGNSSYRGYMIGLGYYWAISRSYDVTAVVQDFTLRGPAETIDFRGKPNETTDFNFSLYGVQDKGVPGSGNPPLKQGGIQWELTATTQLMGFNGGLDYNYLSSLVFREAFANSFVTTTTSEIDSIGFLQRHFDDDQYSLNIAMQRSQLFEDVTYSPQPANEVVIQKLPSLEFSKRDDEIVNAPVPVWYSFTSSIGLFSRQEQTFNTGLTVPRIDVEPRVMTAFNFKGFSLVPSMTVGATDYGNSYSVNSTQFVTVVGNSTSPGCPTTGIKTPPNCTAIVNVALADKNLFRKDADVNLDFNFPAIERVFTPPKWLHLGKKVKHVIETRATYDYVAGIDNFQKIIQFDALDLLSDTNQLTLSLTNRFYKKDEHGNISEFLTWQVSQARYFDPTFGGAVLPNTRNIVLATEDITPFVFLDGPRNYSPIDSMLTVSPYSFFSIDWRTDYDPYRHRFVDDMLNAAVRHKNYFFNVGDTSIQTNPILIPAANQINFGGGYGSSTRKGFNAAASADYCVSDCPANENLLYEFVQFSYNTNCCGFSIQYRRFNLGIRHENQWLASFSIANIGQFGSLQKQSRIF